MTGQGRNQTGFLTGHVMNLLFRPLCVSVCGVDVYVCMHLLFLDMLLSPPDPLERDVRSLAGSLGFYRDEILYIFKKQYPFVYMYDQWIKRDPVNSSLKTLHDSLIKLKRRDAAEIVNSKLQGKICTQ